MEKIIVQQLLVKTSIETIVYILQRYPVNTILGWQINLLV
jgi:hypothetical protein